MTEGTAGSGGLLRVAILTISDRAFAGTYADQSGPALEDLIRRALSAQVVAREIVPDEHAQIAAQLRTWADETQVDLILTTGGTGFAPRDVTPEATREIIEKPAPGLAEAMRAAAREATPYGILSRATAGIRGRTLVLNLPGSPRGAVENLRAILAVLPHAIALIRGEASEHAHHDFRHQSII